MNRAKQHFSEGLGKTARTNKGPSAPGIEAGETHPFWGLEGPRPLDDTEFFYDLSPDFMALNHPSLMPSSSPELVQKSADTWSVELLTELDASQVLAFAAILRNRGLDAHADRAVEISQLLAE